MNNISIIAYLLLTLGIGYAFIYPSFGEINTLLDQKQKYLSSLETVNNIENKKDELLTKFNEIPAADRKEIEAVLPSSLNFVALVSQIDAIAASHGISIDKITSEAVDSSVGNSVEKAAPQKPYRSSIIGFTFVSSYESSNVFLNDLEKSLRILDIRSVKIEPKEDGSYSYSVRYETYWFK
jgi:Tfp pilus assembly protein PilO